MNAMISFVNASCYSAVLTQIYHTHLDPRISFLHSPSDRRISLNLDISEIFTPVLADRLIFSLINRKMIKPSDFEQAGKGIYVSENARRIIVSEWEKFLRNTSAPSESRKMGWRRIMRTEALKVQKYITEGIAYDPFLHKW